MTFSAKLTLDEKYLHESVNSWSKTYMFCMTTSAANLFYILLVKNH